MGRRVRKFDGAFGPEGCGLPSRAMLIKSALRDLLISVIGLDKHSADWLASFASPYPAAPDFPLCRGQNKSLYAFLQRHGSMAKYP